MNGELVIQRPELAESYIPEVESNENEFRTNLFKETRSFLTGQMGDFTLTKVSQLIRVNIPGYFDHSIGVGYLIGALGSEFHQLPFPVGYTLGFLHDLGKVDVKDVVNKPGELTAEERKRMKDHVYFSSIRLQGQGMPNVARVVVGHHLHGLVDSYPENYIEPNKFIEQLHLSMALVDTFLASNIELRPELNDDQLKVRKKRTIKENVRGFLKFFKSEPDHGKIGNQVKLLWKYLEEGIDIGLAKKVRMSEWPFVPLESEWLLGQLE